MRRTILLTAATAVAMLAVTPAFAANTIVTVTPGANAAPAGATTTLNFNTSVATEMAAKSITLTGNGTRGQFFGPGNSSAGGFTFAAPNPSDGGYYGIGGTPVGGTVPGSFATFTSATNQAYSNISVFLGSLDAYNVVKLLFTDGSFETYDGQQLNGGVKPGFPGGAINTRASFTATNGKTYSGVSFYNNGADGSLELDNLAFTAAVPEPATWAMMVLGFSVIGFGMRRRKAVKTTVQFA